MTTTPTTRVWLPTFFVTEADLEKSLPALLQSLRPGGWIALGLMHPPPDPLAAAIFNLRTVRGGGCVLAADRAIELLAGAGLRISAFGAAAARVAPPAHPRPAACSSRHARVVRITGHGWRVIRASLGGTPGSSCRGEVRGEVVAQGRSASSAAPSMSVDLRRRRNGMPITYMPGRRRRHRRRGGSWPSRVDTGTSSHE